MIQNTESRRHRVLFSCPRLTKFMAHGVCGEAADPVGSLVIFLQTVTGLCVSVFDINYTLCGLEWCISTLPALHVLTFRTSGSFQLRTSGSFLLRMFASFQPRTIGNLEEVELWVTAGGSPKGNTCGLSHPLFLTSTSKGVEPRLFCQKEPFITTNELEQLFTEIAPLMSLSLVHDVLRHCVLPGHRGCSRA